MALGRGAKIAIGCVAATLVVVAGVCIMVFGVAWWGYGKAKQAAQGLEADQKRIESARAQANAHPFTAPTDGTIQEDRLLKFLAVRRRLYGVYAKYQDKLEAMDKAGKPDPLFITQAYSAINELRTATAEGLAEQGMSEDEYRYLVAAVYKTMISGGISAGGKSIAELSRAAMESAAQQAEQAAAEAEKNPSLPESAKEQLREAARQARAQVAQAVEVTKEAQVPQQNVELFRKHQAEIQKYAMSGLEFLGL